jgi:hypothetical protein
MRSRLYQPALFEADRAVQETEIDRKRRARFEREEKGRKRRQFAHIEATCCLNWYPGGSGWNQCHTCGKPLHYTTHP